MYRAWPDILASSLNREPSLGRLVELCEENYCQLLRLLPGLRNMRGSYHSLLDGHAQLHLTVLEHARYTSLVHLTYQFDAGAGRKREPDALLRVYHDAKEVEVVELRESILPVEARYEAPGLRNKWQVNLFVSKWLAFCVLQGHRFEPAGGIGRYALA